MSYIEEFKKQITNNNYLPFLKLWEEYCLNEEVNPKELIEILSMVKTSIFADGFGKHVETAVPLWEVIKDEDLGYQVLRLVFDIQTTNCASLANLACNVLKKRYGDHQYYNEKLRLVGLRNKQNFRGALTNFELLNHMDKGKFVFHTGGWGTGEIMEISLIREQLILEFDLVPGRKDLSFQNAFLNLIPLSDDHFLSQRFGNPDVLEMKAKDSPIEVIKQMLSDLGPKTASEIKDELCLLVIPEEDWPKWWQNARAKLKKDAMILSPSSIKDPFSLRDQAISYSDKVEESLEEAQTSQDFVSTIYNFIKNHAESLKKAEFKTEILNKIYAFLEQNLSNAMRCQAFFLLEDILGKKFEQQESLFNLVREIPSDGLAEFLTGIDIAAYKKRVLITMKSCRQDWLEIFVDNVYMFNQGILADYAHKELQEDPSAKTLLEEKTQELIENPTLYPDAFAWFFHKFIYKDEQVVSNPNDHTRRCLESLLVLLHFLEESEDDYRYLVKKTLQMLQKDRFALIRSIIKGASLDYLKEFLLLASKCRSFSEHDLSIFNSLAKVANPEFEKDEKQKEQENIIWTTKEGYLKVKDRMETIATVETIENAEEIKQARSHGDLRENSEYKFALEKRARLQEELRRLSKQFSQARILCPDDIDAEKVGVGLVVTIQDDENNQVDYTLLGPWEADPDRYILSYQSRFAQAMKGLKPGESFLYQGRNFKIVSFRPFALEESSK